MPMVKNKYFRLSSQVLLACSMDGTVAAVILGREENGCPLSETKTYDLLTKSYGKSFGRPPPANTKKTNGTVILENPELLKIKRDNAKVWVDGQRFVATIYGLDCKIFICGMFEPVQLYLYH